MQKQICQVKPARVSAEKLTIKHQRKPRQRMPVVGVRRGKRPGKIFHAKARLNPRIRGNIRRVIINYKIKCHHPAEYGYRNYRKGSSYYPGARDLWVILRIDYLETVVIL